MKIVGIIAEYNPFHNGHLYHINKIKEKYPDSLIVLVLNGLFLQRGEMSVLTKEDKTKIALKNKIDLVVELPVVFGSQSADIFANAAVKILNELKCEVIVFGSESNDKEKIMEIASIQLTDKGYDEKVKEYLQEGINYPTALAKALNVNFDFLANDLLGISYAKAIIKNNFPIEIDTIKRTNDYKDITSNDDIISASNVRNKLKNGLDITPFLPSYDKDIIIKTNEDDYFKLLKYKINTDLDLARYLDVDEGIEYRLKDYINTSSTLDEFISNIKTKRYTYNKLNRLLIHILLGITKDDNELINQNIDYLHILGFNQKGKDYLNNIKTKINTKINKEAIIYKYEINASIIYDLINNTNTIEFERDNKPIIED